MESILVHQTLHGYRKGHSLLASSLPLSGAEELLLLKRSDLTGPLLAQGYNKYLTAYALPDAGHFAFAKTWHASEVERSGAVWTHTLLVNLPDLGTIRDFSRLASLFNRPTALADLEYYREPIEFHEETISDPPRLSPPQLEASRELLVNLYVTPDARVALNTPSAERFETALLQIWSQQWPRLRRAFQFCTGMMSANPAFENFDVLIGPPGWQSSLGAGTAHSSANGSRELDWLKASIQDIQAGGGPLRSFMRQFGAELEGGRGAFADLASLHTLLRDLPRPDYERGVRILAALGPSTADLPRLKAGVLGQSPTIEGESRLLAALIRDTTGAIDLEALTVPDRARLVAKTAPREAINLVRQVLHASSPAAEQVIREIAAELQGSDLALREQDYAVALALIGVRPSFAAEEWAWSTDPVRQRQVLEVLKRTPQLQPQVARAIAGRLLSMDAPLITEALSVLGQSLTEEILDRLAIGEAVGTQWSIAAASRPADVRAWLQKAPELNTESAHVVALSLAPDDPEIISRLHMLLDVAGPTPVEKDDVLGALLFLAARSSDRELAPRIVGSTFTALHIRAAQSRLSQPAWHLVDRFLPHLAWWRDWDMCEKLRRSVADRFVSGNWAASSFLRIVKEPDVLRLTLEYMYGSKEGRRAIDRIHEDFLNLRPSLPPATLKVLLDEGVVRKRDLVD